MLNYTAKNQSALVGLEDYKKYYKSNTARSKDKMLDKYKANIGDGLAKMKTTENKQYWQDQVASEEAKRNRDSKIDKLSVTDLTGPMEETGINAYVAKTGSKITVDKWGKETAPYIPIAQSVHTDKVPVRSKADAMSNVEMLYDRMKAKKAELSS